MMVVSMSIDEPLTNQGERMILETLAESGPVTIPELADCLAVHPVTIERRCHELQRAGLVRRCTGGMFTVDEGRADERSWDSRAAGD